MRTDRREPPIVVLGRRRRGAVSAADARRTVVAVGEGLLRLTPPDAAPLLGARTLEVHAGGAEANVAAGVASLGVPARWWSRVATGPVGDALLHELTAAGVDVGLVVRADGRVGLYVAELGHGERPTRVTYDRAGTTFAGLRPEHLPDDLLAALFDDAAWLHVSGIDLAIDGAPLAALERLWGRAGAAGVRRSFDVNRRATLPGAAALAARAAPYLATADLVFVAERDAHALWPQAAAAGDPAALLAALAALAPQRHRGRHPRRGRRVGARGGRDDRLARRATGRGPGADRARRRLRGRRPRRARRAGRRPPRGPRLGRGRRRR